MIIKPIASVDKSILKDFDCGEPLLNSYLKQYALKNDQTNISKTFLCVVDSTLVGYYSLCTANIDFENYDANSDLPRYPIPCARIARLAIDRRFQKKGYGRKILKDCLTRVLSVASAIGIYLVIVDAKPSAVGFYTRYSFKPLKKDNTTLYLRVSTLLKVFSDEF